MNRGIAFLLMLVLGVLGFPQFATAQNDQLLDALQSCASVDKNKKRLKCFDAAMEQFAPPASTFRAAVSSEASDPSSADTETDRFDAPSEDAKEPILAKTAQDEFGANDLPAAKKAKQKKRPNVMNASLVEIARNNRGKYVIILDNGQIWRQIRADTNKLLVPKEEEGAKIQIKRRTLGAHSFRFEKDNRTIRVERIK